MVAGISNRNYSKQNLKGEIKWQKKQQKRKQQELKS